MIELTRTRVDLVALRLAWHCRTSSVGQISQLVKLTAQKDLPDWGLMVLTRAHKQLVRFLRRVAGPGEPGMYVSSGLYRS